MLEVHSRPPDETVLASGAIGDGVVPFKKLVKILIDHGFDGPATLEVNGVDKILKSKAYLQKEFGIIWILLESANIRCGTFWKSTS